MHHANKWNALSNVWLADLRAILYAYVEECILSALKKQRPYTGLRGRTRRRHQAGLTVTSSQNTG